MARNSVSVRVLRSSAADGVQFALFDYLPTQKRPEKPKPIKKKTNLVVLNRSTQLNIDFSLPISKNADNNNIHIAINYLNKNNTVKFLRRARYGALDYHVPSFLAKVAELHDFADAMEDIGKYAVGHLVTMTEDEVLAHLGGDEHKLALLLDFFAEFELALNMSIPGWKQPDKTHYRQGVLQR